MEEKAQAMDVVELPGDIRGDMVDHRFNYVVTAHRPTAVTHAVTGRFTGVKDWNLVVCKTNRLEIFRLAAEGLDPIVEVPLYGRIAVVRLFRLPRGKKDVLFVLTEEHRACILEWDTDTQQLITKANSNVKDRIGREVDVGMLANVDPKGQLIALHMYDGMVKILQIHPNGLVNRESFNVRLEELQVLDMCFLTTTANPTLAVLYQDPKEQRHVKTYEVDAETRSLEQGPWTLDNVHGDTRWLVAVPEALGGVLLVGGASLTYQNGNKFISVPVSPVMITAIGQVDSEGWRWLVGDVSGVLRVLVMHTVPLAGGGISVDSMHLERLGEISIPSALVYLDKGFVFVGSRFGDSQLIHLKEEAVSERVEDERVPSMLEVVESYTNLGPILDFCVVDLERQGQGQVVTCSGAYKDGSLRIVRNGIGIVAQAEIELEYVHQVWSLKKNAGDPFDKYIVIAFVGETRMMAIEGNEIEEISMSGWAESSTTLFCSTMSGGLCQVTPKGVRIVHPSTGQAMQEWTPPDSETISMADGEGDTLVVATAGKEHHLYSLLLKEGDIVEEHEVQVDVEVSALACYGQWCVMGTWTNHSVRILSRPQLKEVTREEFGDDRLPRSVFLGKLGGVLRLLVAVGDGHLLTYAMEKEQGVLSGKRQLTLGSRPIQLASFFSDGQQHVFASSDRPTVIYAKGNKLLCSNVNLKDVNQVAPFHSEEFQEALVIVTPNSFSIGTIDEIQKLHIRTVPLGEVPVKIAHSTEHRVFCVVTHQVTLNPQTGEESMQSFVRVLRENTFEVTHSVELEKNEDATALMCCEIEGVEGQVFVVGTAYVRAEEEEPEEGRILLFTVTPEPEAALQLLASRKVPGAVYVLSTVTGRVCAGINSSVHIYRWTGERDDEEGGDEGTALGGLVACGGYHGFILALYLDVRGEFICVGDVMKSMTLLRYNRAEDTLEDIARDFMPNWVTSLCMLSDDVYLGGENSFNLFALRKVVPGEEEGGDVDDISRLEAVGQYHVGEFVNQFRTGSLVMHTSDTGALTLPTHLFGCVSGSIGVVASLPQKTFVFLKKLQDRMAQVLLGVGGLDHAQYRTFRCEGRSAPAFGMLDGDLIESFLDLPLEVSEKVVEGLEGCSVQSVQQIVEEMARLH